MHSGPSNPEDKCGGTSEKAIFHRLTEVTRTFLYPFLFEFSLIAMGLLTKLWASGRHSAGGSHSAGYSRLHEPSPTTSGTGSLTDTLPMSCPTIFIIQGHVIY